MEQALAWIGEGVPVQLGVIHLNERAIAFYKKWGFQDTGRIVGPASDPAASYGAAEVADLYAYSRVAAAIRSRGLAPLCNGAFPLHDHICYCRECFVP
jgi:ribosomal protein S18 acetylase RimI-like enzyme